MILIVIIDNQKFMVSISLRLSTLTLTPQQVDVGFGNNCATRPLPLNDGATTTCIAPSEMRLVRDTLAEFTDKSQKVWIYQIRYNPASPWIPNICFSDVEFLPQDFEGMSFAVSQRRTSWFTQVFVCMRMIMDSQHEIIGQYVISGNEVKRRVHGKTEILQTLQSEEGRVGALSQYFGMHLRWSEIDGIRGLTSEIK